MDPGQRRFPTAKTARVALILAANAAALFVLVHALAGRGGAKAPEANAALAQAPAQDLARTPLAGAPASAPARTSPAEFARLERGIRRSIDDALRNASEQSKGKVSARNATVAVHVRELGAAESASLGIESDRAMRPASNLKLLTTATALVLLGPDWSFDTRFEAAGPLAQGVLQGDLVVRAAGDPLYERGGRGGVERFLDPLVAELAAAGLREVHGDLVLDEGTFPAPAPGPAWPDDNQHWAEFCALAGGFSANRGCLTVTVTPADAGERAAVVAEPRGFDLAPTFDVDTIAKGALSIQLLPRAGRLTVGGTIPARSQPWSDACAHPDPVALFGSVLRAALERGGIHVTGDVVRRRGAAGGATLAHLRTPLLEYLPAINSDSTNAVADQVFFATALAARGAATRECGAEATRLALTRLGVPVEGLVQVDGSGLSRSDRVTVRQISALIAAVLDGDPRSAEPWRASLAVAGESGTLKSRLKSSIARGRVQAKTGFIEGTSGLSGVARTQDGREFVFSILVDYPPCDGLNRNCWKPMQEDICELLVGAGS